MVEVFQELMIQIDDEYRTAMIGIRGINASPLLNRGEKTVAFKKIAENLRKMLDEVERMI